MKYERLTGKSECGYNTLDACLNCDLEMDCGLCPYWAKALDRLAELEDKIEQGTLIELPCKVGDTVYYIKRGYYAKPQFCEVSRPCKIVEVSFKLKRNGNGVMSGFITDNGTRYSFDGIGKTVFLTREEAEQRLKELQNG